VLLRRLKPPEATTPTISLALTALKETADAFPPLKSAVGGVIHVLDLAQRVKSNKEECRKLASRAEGILDKIAVAVPDATCISPDLLRIDEFTRTLDDIKCFMTPLCHESVMKRIVLHKERESLLIEFNRRLDDALKSFMLISTIKIEMLVSQQGARLDILSTQHKELVNSILQNKRVHRQQMRVVLFD